MGIGGIFLLAWGGAIAGKVVKLPVLKELTWAQILIFPMLLAMFKGLFKVVGFVAAIGFAFFMLDFVCWVMINHVYDGSYELLFGRMIRGLIGLI